MVQRFRAAGEELAAKRHILQKPTIRALQQISIIGEQAQGARFGLQSDYARRKLTKVVAASLHDS